MSQVSVSSAENDLITELFTTNSSDNLYQYFSKSTEILTDFAVKFLRICNNHIADDYAAHILNAAMKECMEGHDQWGTHTTGGYRSVTIKFAHNASNLAHQVKQWNKYENADESNPWKKKIIAAVGATVYDEFEASFHSISFILC